MVLRHSASMLGLLLAAAAGLPAMAAESAVVVQILDGKQLYIDQKQAEVKERASAPQLVSTRQSRGQLSFNSGAAARINRNSLMRLGSSCFLMEKGQVLISGKQSGCTRTARLSVRGTNYIMEVKDDDTTDITVLEGNVEVQPLKDGKPTGKPPLVLNPGQRAKISVEGALSRLLQLNPINYQQILGGPLFHGFTSSLPGLPALEKFLDTFVPGALRSTVTYTSSISEVDACNQAQYLMPINSKVDRFSVRSNSTLGATSFTCRVYWTYKSDLYYPINTPEEQPILLPWDVPEPSPVGVGWF
ncbi:MAG: hypothetical protein ACKO0M_00065 [Cyanobium sp.]